jgi:DNA-binding IclR family transcriptional regulator
LGILASQEIFVVVSDGPVKSAERVAALLELLGERRTPLRLMDVAQALEIPKSSAHGLLQTLMAKEFVVRDEQQRYRMGMKLFSLAASALGFLDLRELARPTMEGLAERQRATCNLAVLDGHDVLYIEKVEDRSNPVRLVTHVGTRLPAHVTALGKVLVAELPEAAQSLWLSEHEFNKFTEQTRTNRSALAHDLADYERLGYAVDNHEFHDAITGFAAGIQDSTGNVVAALSLTCLAFHLPDEEEAAIGRQVCDAAREISRQLRSDGILGATPP